MALNKILLMGNLGSDPEKRMLPSGKPVSSFRVASNRKYKVEGVVREETEWFSVVAFGRLAEICSEYLHKGKSIFVEGRLRTHTWMDGDGTKHYKTEVIAETMQMIGGRKGNGSGSGDAPYALESAPVTADPDDDDDQPF